jgi:Domain of unknown function (DUF3291)
MTDDSIAPASGGEVFVSLTRLRIRYRRHLPFFVLQSLRSARQARAASGNIAVSLLADQNRTYWTRSLWSDVAAMRAFMLSGVHRSAMRKLAAWCDEASVAHWTQATAQLPSWEEAHRRMQGEGRRSKVNHPSPEHEAFQIAVPMVRAGRELRFK